MSNTDSLWVIKNRFNVEIFRALKLTKLAIGFNLHPGISMEHSNFVHDQQKYLIVVGQCAMAL